MLEANRVRLTCQVARRNTWLKLTPWFFTSEALEQKLTHTALRIILPQRFTVSGCLPPLEQPHAWSSWDNSPWRKNVLFFNQKWNDDLVAKFCVCFFVPAPELGFAVCRLLFVSRLVFRGRKECNEANDPEIVLFWDLLFMWETSQGLRSIVWEDRSQKMRELFVTGTIVFISGRMLEMPVQTTWNFIPDQAEMNPGGNIQNA